MMLTCPVCEALYDYDGFEEHGHETLYYCECGAIFDKKENVISKEKIDMTGLEDQGRSLFIKASRIKEVAIEEIKNIKAHIETNPNKRQGKIR